MPAFTVQASITALLSAVSLGHPGSAAADIADKAQHVSSEVAAPSQAFAIASLPLTGDLTVAPCKEDGVTLQDVIVTATRREEKLQDVPSSVVALSQAALDMAGTRKIDDIAAIVPGIEFGRPAYGPQISFIAFRGLTTVAGASTVGVYIDDIPIQGRISTSGLSFFGSAYPVAFDLNRIEALRGPQGTLFGAGAEGGAVRFIFNKPDLQKRSGSVRTEVATTEKGALSYEYGAAIGGPIVEDSLGFRASAFYRSDGGFVDRMNPFTGAAAEKDADRSSTQSYRLAFTKALGDNLEVTPSFVYQKSKTSDTSVFQQYSFDPAPPKLESVKLLPQPTTDEFYLASLDVQADLGSANLAAVSSYYSREGDTLVDITNLFGSFSGGYGDPRGDEFPTSYADAGRQPASVRQEIFTQEVRLASDNPDAMVSWLVGAFYSHARQDDEVNVFSPALAALNGLTPDDTLLYSASRAIDTQAAIFGQIDVRLTDKVTANIGLRAAWNRADIKQYSGGYYNDGVPPVSGAVKEETPLTPKLGLTYKPDERNMYYASISRGYRVGGGNTPLPDYCEAQPKATYASDYVWNYEIGAKNRLFDGRVQIEASAFVLKWKNIQENPFLPCGFAFNANAGNAESKGFDISVQASVTPNLSLGLGVAYADAKHEQDSFYEGFLLVRKGDAVGAVPQVVSPWNVNVTARYDIPLPDEYDAYVWVENLYRSKNEGPFSSEDPASLAYFPDLHANPATNELNARIGIVRGPVEASLFVNNLTNSQPKLYKNVDFSGSAIVSYSTFRPRTVGISLDYKF